MKILLVIAASLFGATRCFAGVRRSVVANFTTRVAPCAPASKEFSVALRDVLSTPNAVSQALPPGMASLLEYDVAQLDLTKVRGRMVLGPMMRSLPANFGDMLRKAAAASPDDPENQFLIIDVTQNLAEAYRQAAQSEDVKAYLREQARQSLSALAEGELTTTEFYHVADFLSRFGLYGEELQEIVLPVIHAAKRIRGDFAEDDELKFFRPMRPIEPAEMVSQIARVYLGAETIVTEEDFLESRLQGLIAQKKVPVKRRDASVLTWPSLTALDGHTLDAIDLAAMPRLEPESAAAGFPVLSHHVVRLILAALTDAFPLNAYEIKGKKAVDVVDADTEESVCRVANEKTEAGRKIRIIFRPPGMDHSVRAHFLRRAFLGHGILVEATADPDSFDVHPRTLAPERIGKLSLH